MESIINRNVWIVTGCSIILCTVIEQHANPEWFVVESTDGYKQTTAAVFLTPSAAATEARERAELLINAATRIERAAESENE